jgi:membrane associated rhomboid family serine protease
MTIADQIKHQFKTGSELTRVIYINLAVFFLMLIIKILGNIVQGPDNTWQQAVEVWIALPSDPLTFLTRPWTLITYMFLHVGFWHLFWNLILLYFTGIIFLEYLGGKRFLTAYVGGGIAGGLLYFVITNFSPSLGTGYLLGASAGVWGVVAAIALYVPNLPVRLFFALKVKLWHVAIFMFIGDLISLSNYINPGGMLAHLGGAIFGYYMVTQLRKGKDISETA